jgi:hypothetical protein
MIDAQSPVAIRAVPDLCLGIILQLGHLRLPTNLISGPLGFEDSRVICGAHDIGQ